MPQTTKSHCHFLRWALLKLSYVLQRTRQLGIMRIGGKRRLLTVEGVVMLNDIGRFWLGMCIRSWSFSDLFFFLYSMLLMDGVWLWRLVEVVNQENHWLETFKLLRVSSWHSDSFFFSFLLYSLHGLHYLFITCLFSSMHVYVHDNLPYFTFYHVLYDILTHTRPTKWMSLRRFVTVPSFSR